MKSILSFSLSLLLLSAVSATAGNNRSYAYGHTPEDFDFPMYSMDIGEGWYIDEDIGEISLLLSLQGLANKERPQLYFVYPEDWIWKITRTLKNFYENRWGFEFQELSSPEEALETLGHHATGYVVWDKEERLTLMLAFTRAGLDNVLVVDEANIPRVEAIGLEMVEDYRGEFVGMTDAEIFEIAMDRYWDRSNKDIAVWQGGFFHSRRMEPAIADYGIFRGAFQTDLSANPEDVEEMILHRRILDELNPRSLVMGWHSYSKDTEGQHVTLLSSYGHMMEGLNSLPNISFNTQIPFTEDFEFRNNHSVEPDEILIPEEKVYISLIQTDSMGIGAWELEGRGEIPYAWQPTGGWSWLSPAAIQYFNESSTPNDYFIAGGLSGPAYMYPKPIPEEHFWPLMEMSNERHELLDLRVMEIMDYSEGNRHVGNQDLPKELVERYYEAFPNVIGFINGYGAARTFDNRDGIPFISYDYYLGLGRPPEEAVADLEELMRLNQKRPYFLLIHVRESQSVGHVAGILNALPDAAEVVPLDIFLKKAGQADTIRQRFMSEDDPVDFNAY